MQTRSERRRSVGASRPYIVEIDNYYRANGRRLHRSHTDYLVREITRLGGAVPEDSQEMIRLCRELLSREAGRPL